MIKRILACLIIINMSVALMPQILLQAIAIKTEVNAATTLKNPIIVDDYSMNAEQKVTYSCIWFGAYPQTEIVNQASTCGTHGKVWAQDSDYEENDSLYTALKNTTGWDSNGDVTLEDGTKYRRIKQSDATYSNSSSDEYYSWNSSSSYHYFRYEPIKWRVLKSSKTQAFLLADKVLDDQMYYPTSADVTTWKTSTIRSWLNGYVASNNNYGTDYSNKNFINSAFTSSERKMISSTYLDNMKTGPYAETNGGENTTDKIFLLSAYDTYKSDESAAYGFYKYNESLFDEARRCKSSTYAKAMGLFSTTLADYLGNCGWWLRSMGRTVFYASYVYFQGMSDTDGISVGSEFGVRPALYLNISSSDLISYAGTVCTDGTIKEVNPGKEKIATGDEIIQKSQTISASNKTITINNKAVRIGAKTSGDGKLTYKSSNNSVATVSSTGIVTPKKYGSATVTITASETKTYKAASKKITISIVPEKMAFKAAKSPAKKTILLKWAKNKTVSGYQVQISLKSNFKSYTSSKEFKNTVVKKKISGLKSKPWYARIRAYKKIGSKKYYGPWSTVKKIKVK